jgi:hypothetical protein
VVAERADRNFLRPCLFDFIIPVSLYKTTERLLKAIVAASKLIPEELKDKRIV